MSDETGHCTCDEYGCGDPDIECPWHPVVPSLREKMQEEIERLKEARGTLIVERNDAQSRMKGAVSEWSRRVDSLRSLLATAEKERDEARESLGICSHHQDILAEDRDALAARVTALEAMLGESREILRDEHYAGTLPKRIDALLTPEET